MSAPQYPTPAFDPEKDRSSGATPGPGWSGRAVQASLARIRSAPTVEAAAAQAASEQLVVLHSIRTILLWTLVVVPVFLVALGITLVVLDTPSPATTTCGTFTVC